MNRRHRKIDGFAIVFVLFIVIVLPFALWMHFSAPCGAHKFSPTKDIPARCLSHYSNPR